MLQSPIPRAGLPEAPERHVSDRFFLAFASLLLCLSAFGFIAQLYYLPDESSFSLTPIIRTEKYYQASKSSPSSGGLDSKLPNPVVLVIAFNRPDYLQKQLESLKKLPRIENFAVVVSQDGVDQSVADVVQKNSDWVDHILHPRHSMALGGAQPVTALLAQHYKWAFDEMFLQRNHSHVVVVEDDMVFSPDFLRLFEQTGWLLDRDPSIWCVSSWNDLGFAKYALDPLALRRTDFFPGLGWMLRRQLWLELGPKFPSDHWDHWMRLDTVSQGRSCVFPEVSRNFNVGQLGSTVNLAFFEKFILANVAHANDVVDFGNVDYLLEKNYDKRLRDLVDVAEVLADPDGETLRTTVNKPRATDATVVVPTTTTTTSLVPYRLETYAGGLAPALGFMSAPRATYKGVIVLHIESGHLLLVDARESSFVPPTLALARPENLVVLAGASGKSCVQVCAGQDLHCSPENFQFVNKCSVLKSVFPCEKGCLGSVIGPDVPNYVSDPAKKEMFRYCLTTEGTPSCEAAHWSTSRVCPCL